MTSIFVRFKLFSALSAVISLSFISGVLVGRFAPLLDPNTVTRSASSNPTPSPDLLTPSVNDLVGCPAELKLVKRQVEEAREECSRGSSAADRKPSDPSTVYYNRDGVPAERYPEGDPERSVSWRISSIEKFVPLSDEQRQRLRDKFRADRMALLEGSSDGGGESLEDIIGADAAGLYREQVRGAFERGRLEQLERDGLWLARKLSLNQDDERKVQGVLSDVEKQLDREFSPMMDGAPGSDGDPGARVGRMIEQNKRRLALRAEGLKGVLSPDQYQGYLLVESQSSGADMEIFHGGGAEGPAQESAAP
jgi:hypothetical protein